MMFDPFILIGSIWFYAMFVAFAVIMLAFVEYDKGWGSVWAVVIFLAIISQTTDFALFGWLIANPVTAATYVFYYFALGTVWGIAKWWFYCRKLLDVVNDMKTEYMNKNNIAVDFDDNQRSKFIDRLLMSHDYTDSHFPPQAMSHKADWLMWATYWPFSFFWTMLNQPIKYIWQFIYSHLGSVMQRISNSVFKGI